MSEPLGLWMHGGLIATINDAGAGMVSLTHVSETVAEEAGRKLLSVRLPVRSETYPAVAARPFIEGLAPEGATRIALADAARIDPIDTFALLRAYGRECAGAVMIAPLDDPPPALGSRVRWLTDQELTDRVAGLRVAPLGADLDNGVRVSLGGLQSKLVVVVEDGKIGLPVGSTPSTHLLKPAHGSAFSGIVQVEAFALRLAAAASEHPDVKLRAARCEVMTVGEEPALLVERFDRVVGRGGDNTVRRLHQEDGCQALGLLPARKYQTGTDKTPSFQAIADVIDGNSANPIDDKVALLQAMFFTVLVGNADMHAKNVAFLHSDDGIRLAPLYDPVPTVVFDDTSRELGMRINSEHHLDDVGREQIRAEAIGWKLGARLVDRSVDALAEIVTATVAEVQQQASDEDWHSDLIDMVAARALTMAGDR